MCGEGVAGENVVAGHVVARDGVVRIVSCRGDVEGIAVSRDEVALGEGRHLVGAVDFFDERGARIVARLNDKQVAAAVGYDFGRIKPNFYLFFHLEIRKTDFGHFTALWVARQTAPTGQRASTASWAVSMRET